MVAREAQRAGGAGAASPSRFPQAFTRPAHAETLVPQRTPGRAILAALRPAP